MKYNILCGTLLATSLVAGGSAWAENNGGGDEAADANALLAAKVTAVQAAQAAEAKIGGKTSSVSFERHAGTATAPFFHVEVVTPDGAQQEVAVDAASGEVVRVLALEHDENGEAGDGEGQDPDGDGIAD
ncbi:PepSY domain-containing protein [Mesorhizobium escarrei]|uniref:PepSY domain-containing protein n=1 Tax=Mesorhizobium escarrei TaxID=666018 RepID=A0ABM9E581_9HYPH|nr:PepSY domain-containing protein [Mesorhizobium escarrei]CAH2404249.1 PepSY domain-containing protein [Mesorhizobium escarrei]